jgi:hypothetical protein
MTQNTNSTTIQVKLTGPADWDRWNHQFKAEAVSAQLWEHINQNEALLPKPKMPLIESYPRQATRSNESNQNVDAVGMITRSSNAEASSAGTSIPSVSSASTVHEFTANDLTAQGRNAYQLDMQRYVQQQKEYKEQQTLVR